MNEPTDLDYFKALREKALDFTMKAFYTAIIRQLEGPHVPESV